MGVDLCIGSGLARIEQLQAVTEKIARWAEAEAGGTHTDRWAAMRRGQVYRLAFVRDDVHYLGSGGS